MAAPKVRGSAGRPVKHVWPRSSAARKPGGVAFPADDQTARRPCPRSTPSLWPRPATGSRPRPSRSRRARTSRASIGERSKPMPACRSRFIAGDARKKRCDARPPRTGQAGQATVGRNRQPGLVKIRLRAFEPRRLVFVPLVLFDILFDLVLLGCIATQPSTDTGGAAGATVRLMDFNVGARKHRHCHRCELFVVRSRRRDH